MARVPRHFRDKLVSSTTGVNTLDTSGETIARGVTRAADSFQQAGAKALNTRKREEEKAEAEKKRAAEKALNKAEREAEKAQLKKDRAITAAFKKERKKDLAISKEFDRLREEKEKLITKTADEFQREADKVADAQHTRVRQSQAAKSKAEYLNQYMTAAQEIKTEFAEDPAAGFDLLMQMSGTVKEGVLGSIDDGLLRSEITPALDALAAQQAVNGKSWQIKQLDTIEKQFLVDVQSTNIDTILKGASEAEYDIMVSDDTFTEENYIDVFGIEDGPKNFQTAKNALFRARSASLLEKGAFFAAQDFIQSAEEPDEATRKSVAGNFVKMQKGSISQEFFQTTTAAAVDIVETTEKVLADDMTAADLEDRVLEIAFKAENASDPKTKAALFQYGEILADIRDMKMEQTLLNAAGDTDVEAELQAGFEILFSKKDGVTTKNPEVYLSDFFNFQKNVSRQAKAGNVSVGHYNKWMYWSKVALQDLNFEPRDQWWGGAWGNDDDRQRLDADHRPLMKEKLRTFLEESDEEERENIWKQNVLQEVFEGIPTGGEALLTEDSIKQLFTRAKTRATLIERGYSIDALDSKIIKTSGGSYPWAGTDQDGMPIVSVDAAQFDRK